MRIGEDGFVEMICGSVVLSVVKVYHPRLRTMGDANDVHTPLGRMDYLCGSNGFFGYNIYLNVVSPIEFCADGHDLLSEPQ